MEGILNLLIERDDHFNNKTQELSDALNLTDHLLNQRIKHKQLVSGVFEEKEKLKALEEGGFVFNKNMDQNDINKQLIDLYREKSELETKISEASAKIENAEKIKVENTEKIRNMESEKENMEAKIIEFEAKNEKLKIDQQKTNEECESMSEQMINLITEVEKLTATVEYLRRHSRESEAYIKEAERTSTHIKLNKYCNEINLGQSPIRDICFGPRYKSFFAVTEDKKLIQTSFPVLQEILKIPTESVCNRLKLDNDSNFLALCCQDSKIRILDTTTGRFVATLESHKNSVTDLEWMSKYHVLSSSKDRTVKHFDVNRKAVINTVNAMCQVFSLTKVLNGNDQVYAGACLDGNIRVFDMRQKAIAMNIKKVHSKSIASILSSGYDSTLVTTGLDNKVILTDVREGKQLRAYEDPGFVVNDVDYNPCLTPGGGYLCAGSANKSIALFDLSGYDEPIFNRRHKTDVLCTAASANILLSGDKSGNLLLWTKE